ncbi:hypothetical protein [Nonomuraea longicatena]|jgi:hypothetical protein|uniref:FxLD family lantipeptide n=1 Tax=Nonomuraea longicatena TaxID=83682 RepID=A0ABN1NQE7_9ACTN
MSENTAPEPQDGTEPQDEVEALVEDLEVHGLDAPADGTVGCSGHCTGTC